MPRWRWRLGWRDVAEHRARKRFGQHFLHDGNVIDRIVRAINPKPGEALVEIGPGLGALTVPLLKRCDVLTVIEIDRDVIPPLREACGHHPGLKVIQADALEVDFATLRADGPLRVVGNLPYNISTPLLFHLLEHAGAIEDMHFMLQKEVVRRMAAEPDTDDYGRLTATIAARAEVAELFTVGPGAFTPPPQVDSAVVRLVPRPPPFAIDNLARYDEVVKLAFGQRRKTLSNALRSIASASRIEAAGIDPRARGETLSPADFARLANSLEP
ncbi:MAG TPA: 16S rRNA (adenine(1518)-N(6)/adenine(1519)-N(6))-dimethyltransferase RsmA [Verrucomicrobiae bacterium]|nr:16S rRNA (adenine(1518)-N(6)/adenine(1519)-N(6))-dimethyltransferase RsmA [Verrucomicrobiae bacterium]